MCEPTTAMLAISAISAGVSVVQQQQQASAQRRVNERATSNSLKQWAQSQSEINTQRRQNSEATAQQTRQYNQEAARAQASQTVAMGERGVGGNTAARSLGQIQMENAQRVSVAERQNSYAQTQAGFESRAADSRFQGQQSSLPQIQRPDYLSAGLQVASTYYQGQRYKAENPQIYGES